MEDLKIHIGLVVLSFLMITFMPESSYACGSDSPYNKQSGYTFQTGSTSFHNDCCQKDFCQERESHSDCSDQCCGCGIFSVITIELFTPTDFYLKTVVAPERKLNFGSPRTDLSLGFHSIWQPPKIS